MGTVICDANRLLLGYYSTLPAANDALVFIPVKAAGLPTDAALSDCDNLAAVWATGAVEQTVMGRVSVTATTKTIDKANNRTDVDCADLSWTAPSGDPVGKLLVCYDPDVPTGTDADLKFLSAVDFAVTPDGATDVNGTVDAAGLYRAA